MFNSLLMFMVAVNAAAVKAVLRMGTEAPTDAEITQFIADAVATAYTEFGLTVDSASCSATEYVIIRNLAAVYCWAKQTGLTSSGYTFQLGDYQINSNNSMPANIRFLLDQAKKLAGAGKKVCFRVGVSE